jgi:ferredoxin
MACVSQCPGRALESGQDVPQLRFIEQNCVQCAMCSRTCPEQAITIGPRYLFDPEQRRQRRLLNEDEPFRCTECGKVFATRSVIRRTTERLRDHPMFRGHALKRLKMCEDCRVRDAFREENGPPGP